MRWRLKGDCLAVCQGYIGSEIAGEALLVFNEGSCADMARLMRYPERLDAAAELEVLLDASNVLIGACLKGLADQLNVLFSQGHPAMLGRHPKLGELVGTSSGHSERTLTVEIGYAIEAYNINCELLLLFTGGSLPALNEKIDYLLNEHA